MSIERVRSWFWSLGKFDSVVVMLIIAIAGLLLFRLPEVTYFKGLYFNETLQFTLIALWGLLCVLILKPPTITYFGWPKLKWIGAFMMIIAIAVVALEISIGYNIKQPLRVKIAGVITLLSIGWAEEMIARVVIFGSLLRFGTRFAVITSSVIFGLMHINVYLPDWDGWSAYWHVMMATGFGLFICALFIATRSYWVVVIVHALSDWTVVFDKKNTITVDDYSPGIIEGLWWGVQDFTIQYGFLGLCLLYILRGRWPKWAIHLAIKWKLVEQADEMVGQKQANSFTDRAARLRKLRFLRRWQ